MVKLYFAYLQYPVPEFYALSLNCPEGSRELLLAFSWLLVIQDVLSVAIDKKISNSILANEFTSTYSPTVSLRMRVVPCCFKRKTWYSNTESGS